MPPHPDVSWQLLQLGLPNLCPSKSIFDSNDWNVSPNRIYIFIAQTFQNLPHSVGHHWTSVSGENPWKSLATFCFFMWLDLGFDMWLDSSPSPIPGSTAACSCTAWSTSCRSTAAFQRRSARLMAWHSSMRGRSRSGIHLGKMEDLWRFDLFYRFDQISSIFNGFKV